MEKLEQVRMILDYLEDYKEGMVTLGLLVQRIEGIVEAMDDQKFKTDIFEDFLALDEVYARTRIGEFDFEAYGKPVVITAIENIADKCKFYSEVRH